MTKGSLFNLEYRNYREKTTYLWYRDYCDSRHLDDSTIVRFGIAIYRDNRQHRAPILTQQTTASLAAHNDVCLVKIRHAVRPQAVCTYCSSRPLP